jgi:DNA topoisomerase-1
MGAAAAAAAAGCRCKRNEVPIEKVFNKSLLSKFLWAMDVEPEFRF